MNWWPAIGAFAHWIASAATDGSRIFISWAKDIYWKNQVAAVGVHTAIFILTYTFILLLLPAPITISNISALTETVTFTIKDRQMGAVPIAGMKHIGQAPAPGCLSGILIPDVNAVLSYKRQLSGDIAISLLKGMAGFQSSDNNTSLRIQAPASFVVETSCQKMVDGKSVCKDKPDDEGCPALRLPISGFLQVGEEPRPFAADQDPPAILIEGRLKVIARSVNLLWSGSGLYPVTEIELPVGSRVLADPDEAGTGWWGTVYIDPGRVGLQVQLATEASRLLVFRANTTRADEISVSKLAQAFLDPVLVRLQIVFGAGLAFAQLLMGLAGLRGKGDA
jgi:hypothetical protein